MVVVERQSTPAEHMLKLMVITFSDCSIMGREYPQRLLSVGSQIVSLPLFNMARVHLVLLALMVLIITI